jgi:hypothetical protein
VTEPAADPDDKAAAARAVASAAAALGFSASEPAETWLVNRTNPAVSSYFLVVFGAPQAAIGLAAVERATGSVFAKATLPGRGPHRVMSAEEAIRIAGMGTGTEAILMWDSVQISSSPFYPQWRLRKAGQTVWVDSVTGTVSDTLETKTGGGEPSR